MMDMDDATFQRHLRLNREQFELLNRTLGELGMDEAPTAIGGGKRIPLERKKLLFLWYMANNNSFRELSDKFNVSKYSSCYCYEGVRTSVPYLTTVHSLAQSV